MAGAPAPGWRAKIPRPDWPMRVGTPPSPALPRLPVLHMLRAGPPPGFFFSFARRERSRSSLPHNCALEIASPRRCYAVTGMHRDAMLIGMYVAKVHRHVSLITDPRGDSDYGKHIQFPSPYSLQFQFVMNANAPSLLLPQTALNQQLTSLYLIK